MQMDTVIVFGIIDGYTVIMEKEQQKAIWMNMMMTAIRKKYGLSRPEFVPIAFRYGIVSFLLDQYDLLHYYDNDYVVNDVEKYIEEQGGNLNDVSGIG